MGRGRGRPRTIIDGKQYNRDYQRSLHRIIIAFNPKNAEDEKMWSLLESKGEGNKVGYIKSLILKDMNGGE